MERGRLRAYWLAARPYSSAAALVPILIGTGAAKVLYPRLNMHFGGFLIALAGALSVSVMSHALNARSELDEARDPGRFNVIRLNLTPPEEMLGLAVATGVIGILIGLYFLLLIGLPLLALILLGAFCTMWPVKSKHRAVGDLAVLSVLGLGIAYGAYLVQARDVPSHLDAGRLVVVLAYALPTTLVTLGILLSNDLRDRAEAPRPESSMQALRLCLVVPYGLAFATSLGMLTTPWTLLCLLSIPALPKIFAEVGAERFDYPLVLRIARFHGLFGLLTAVGLAIAASTR